MKSTRRGLGALVVAAALTTLPATFVPVEARAQSAQASAAQIQKVIDRNQIENLMGRRAYLHAAGRNDLEFELFARRPDISWGQNQGFMVGPESIREYYVEDFAVAQARDLERHRRLYPEIPDGRASYGAGGFTMHALSTPVIEIAADGQTAKGMWYTPGALVVWEDGEPKSFWMWERYAVDFIKEDGEWRFWHILVITDFMVPMTEGIGQNLRAENAGARVGSDFGDTQTGTQFDIPSNRYKDWAPTTVPQLIPPPVPYRTFSETHSYGPPQ